MHRPIIVWINNNNNSLFVYFFCKLHHFVFITTSHILVAYLQQEEDFLLYEIAILVVSKQTCIVVQSMSMHELHLISVFLLHHCSLSSGGDSC